jgi:hypothetical protein
MPASANNLQASLEPPSCSSNTMVLILPVPMSSAAPRITDASCPSTSIFISATDRPFKGNPTDPLKRQIHSHVYSPMNRRDLKGVSFNAPNPLIRVEAGGTNESCETSMIAGRNSTQLKSSNRSRFLNPSQITF